MANGGFMEKAEVVIYSRTGCHLCEVAENLLDELHANLLFSHERVLIDGDAELEYKYGEQVPVITINGKVHDFFRLDPKRFTSAIEELTR